MQLILQKNLGKIANETFLQQNFFAYLYSKVGGYMYSLLRRTLKNNKLRVSWGGIHQRKAIKTGIFYIDCGHRRINLICFEKILEMFSEFSNVSRSETFVYYRLQRLLMPLGISIRLYLFIQPCIRVLAVRQVNSGRI